MDVRMRPDLGVVLVLAGALALPSAALAGRDALVVRIANAGADPITCHAEVAHWFATDLGEIAPGANLALDLWRDPATGTVTTRNTAGEFLPVERAWCGVKGRAYQTRWQITLNRAADGRPVADQSLTCTARDGGLDCR